MNWSRWNRATLTFWVIPLIIISSCAGLPEPHHLQAHDESILDIPANSQASYHFLLGYLAELRQDHVQALKEYRQALAHDPGSAFLKVRLAKVHFSAGEMTKALDWANQVSLHDDLPVSTLILLAKMYDGAGETDRALSFYDRAITESGDSIRSKAESTFSKGILLITLKRYEEAKQVFQEGLVLVPASHIGHYYLGKTFMHLNELAKAQRSLEQSIQLAPRYKPAYQELVRVLEQQEKISEAVTVYERFLQQEPSPPLAIRQQFVRLLLREKLYAQALTQLEIIQARNPHALNTQVQIALVHGEMGQHASAIEDLTTIIHAHPAELRVRDYLGLMYEETKDYDQAIQMYLENLARDNTFYESRLHLGYLFYRLKRYQDGLPHLKRAVELKPTQSDAPLVLGLTYLQLEQLTLAVDTFEEAIALHPNNADLRFNLGTAYDKLDRFPDVVQEMETVLRLNPHHADALNYLGYSYADRGIHVEEAVRLTTRAVELKPQNGYYVDSLGWALFKVGRIQEALNHMKRAAFLVKDDPVVFEHLGEIYLLQHNRQEAQKAWRRALELDPANTELNERFQQQGFVLNLQEGKVPTIQPGVMD
ncbi:MAG: tetratricopeptide repeat protein [Nitrospirales bacterium]|nr:tetratricopeptide repeat protein [Nitrospirales bacterium]